MNPTGTSETSQCTENQRFGSFAGTHETKSLAGTSKRRFTVSQAKTCPGGGLALCFSSALFFDAGPSLCYSVYLESLISLEIVCRHHSRATKDLSFQVFGPGWG